MKFSVFAAALVASVSALPLASQAKDLTVGLSASTTSMDPQFYVVGPNSAMARNIFDGLVNQDDKQQIQPALAVSWTIVDDTTWEFKLREGVKFHDGSDFTAEDVVASIKRIPLASTNSPSSFAAYVKAITEVTAVDPLTVRIKTSGPTPLLLNNLSRIAILPAEMEKVTTGEMNTGKGVIGTGPFKFVSWSPDDNVVVAKNDTYWGEKAQWDKVTFRVFKNPSARVAAMLSGDVDMIENIPTADTRRLGSVRQDEGRQHCRQPHHVSAHGPEPCGIAVCQGSRRQEPASECRCSPRIVAVDQPRSAGRPHHGRPGRSCRSGRAGRVFWL